MVLPLYLAQTAVEMAGNPVSQYPAYMACHFSPAGPGLSNVPSFLPAGTMLILDDSNPWTSHDPDIILKQLTEIMETWRCSYLLLDFERPDCDDQQNLAKLLTEVLPFPVGVSADYARGLSCPVFLPALPPDKALDAYLAPWQGREIWLEAALEGITLTLTEAGCQVEPLWDFPEDGLTDQRLHCRYAIETVSDSAIFHLWRTWEDLNGLLEEAKSRGTIKAIGLWQELARDT